MILLDTNALIWLITAHPRAKPLSSAGRLYLSPVSVLELKFLMEVGRLNLSKNVRLQDIIADARWQVDSPASDALFDSALGLTWTRDPFDRLLVAHANFRRWRMATGDRKMLSYLAKARVLAL